MRRALVILRWLLAAPAAIVVWYAVFAAGLICHGWVDRTLCPEGAMTSGGCSDPGVLRTLQGVVVFFIALSAVAVVAATAFVAPSHRAIVAWTAFGVGTLVALYFASATGEWVGGLAAIAAGLVTAFLIARSAARPALEPPIRPIPTSPSTAATKR